MASTEKRQKILLATLAGMVLLFATVWVAYRRVKAKNEETGTETASLGEMEDLFPTSPESAKPTGLDIVLDAVPGKSWQLPPFQTVIKDLELAKSLQEQMAEAPPIPEGKFVATSPLWILTIRDDGEQKSQASLIPHLQPAPSRKKGEEPFQRTGLAIQQGETALEVREPLETLLRDVIHVWFREAQSPRSPLSPFERKRASRAQMEYDLLWPKSN